MSLLLLLSSTSATVSFVDAGGLNPLPPGIIVTLTAASGFVVGSAMLQAGGVYPGTVGAGTFTASFVGTQAPTVPVTFTSTSSTAVVSVPNYQSPVYSAPGYAAEGASQLPTGWFTNPSGLATYPYGVGPNMYSLLLGLGQGKALPDAQLQQVIGAMRLPSSQGASVDSFAYDFFAGTFYRFAQYGETDAQWISRIEAIFATQKCTVAGLQQIINVFWPWILLQMGATSQNFGEDTTFGGEDTIGGEDFASSPVSASGASAGLALGDDTFGGEDTGATFEDAPGPTLLTPVPIVFDAQTNPTYAAYIGLTYPQFCVYLYYAPNSNSLMQVIQSPSAILTALVTVWRAVGTGVVYANNL